MGLQPLGPQGIGVDRLTVYRLPTVTELLSANNQLLTIVKYNKNIVLTTAWFGETVHKTTFDEAYLFIQLFRQFEF